MRKLFSFILCLALLLTAVSALADGTWGQEPVCFTDDDHPVYIYDDSSMPDGHLKIAIKFVDERPARQRQYFICDIQVKSGDVLTTAFFNPNNMKRTGVLEQIAQDNQAVLAVNCDFCGDHDSGVIIRNGQLYRAEKTYKLDMLMIDGDGNFSLHNGSRTQDDVKALGQQLLSQGIRHTIEFGPALVKDGQAVPFTTKADTDNKYVVSTRSTQLESRTAIGQISPNHYVIIVADGTRSSNDKWDGYSLQELQQMFLDCGAQTAINLDGGGSTKLYFYGQILNKPTSPTRQVSDALIFK